MSLDAKISRFAEHNNAFGVLRLLFASLVIFSHTPELVDGNRSRELLSRMLGTLSFGELAVDGFFIISGYLIVGSFLKKPEWQAYLIKRVARIYPGFIVASLLTLLVAGPLSGAVVPHGNLFKLVVNSAVRILTLQPPWMEAPFAGTPYPMLNGATWTIAYEFRCYLLVLVLAAIGWLRHVWLIAALAAACLAGAAMLDPQVFARIEQQIPFSLIWVGALHSTLRLTGIFLAGSFFYLKSDRISFTRPGVVLATIVLLACMSFIPLADIGVATAGAYILFAVAQWGASTWMSRINNRNDISYGVYLYGWPVEKLLFWYAPSMPLIPAGLITLALSCMLGWLSWQLVEKPVMRLIPHRRSRYLTHPPASSPAA